MIACNIVCVVYLNYVPVTLSSLCIFLFLFLYSLWLSSINIIIYKTLMNFKVWKYYDLDQSRRTSFDGAAQFVCKFRRNSFACP